MNFIGKQTIGVYENYFSVQGRPPQNADSTQDVFYPRVAYHNVRLNWKVTPKYNFYLGADNVFDTLPPGGLLGNEGGNPYDPIGRYFYAGFRADF
jgi:outer membrane receptor protein involved in Fe transport